MRELIGWPRTVMTGCWLLVCGWAAASVAHAQTVAPLMTLAAPGSVSVSGIERLTLRSGEELRGRSVSLEGELLLWEDATGNVLTIPLTEVASIALNEHEADEADLPPLPLPSSITLSSPLAEPAPSAADGALPQPLTMPLTSAPPATDDPAATDAQNLTQRSLLFGTSPVVPVRPLVEPIVEPLTQIYGSAVGQAVLWTQRITVGGQFNDGNNESQMVNINVDLERSTPKQMRQFDSGGQWGANQGVRTVNRWWINSNFDWPLNEEQLGDKWITFVTTRNEYNQLANLDYRGTISSGLGYRFLNEPTRRLITRVGPAFTIEIFNNPNDTRTTPDMFGEVEIRWRLFNRATLEERVRVQPNIVDFNLVRVFNTTNLFLDLDKDNRWKLTLGTRLEYLSIPNPGRLKTDVFTTLSLTYVRK